MKKNILIALFFLPCGIIIFLFLSRLDAAIEIDSLKEQIKLQRREMLFLESIANGTLSSCKTSVKEFEILVREKGRDVIWQSDAALVGPFKITRRESCIVSINAIGLP